MHAALARVDGRRCVREALTARPLGSGPVWLAALGKAAAAMAAGAHEAAGGAIARTLIITRDAESCASLAGRPGTEVFLGGHPLPDERSLAAGAQLLAWLAALPQDAQPLFLVSGGASSLIEVLAAGVTLEELRALNRAGLGAGIGIAEFNARRLKLSAIKGGRLAQRLRGRAARALFISDVPGDDPAVIGSGILGPAPTGEDRIERTLIASIDAAVAAAGSCASGYGLTVHAPRRRFDEAAVRVAARCAHELSLLPAQVCVWGGESTVALPPHPGCGGRNQHLALAAARLIAGHPELLLLAVGTDGSDGVSGDAGALVDADTCARVALAELDADECLQRADAGRALAASGDLIHTGPTGTNVGDLVIGLKMTRAAAAALPGARGGAHARVL